LELLRQTRSRTPTNKAFPRSEVVQNLSVLVSALDWIVRAGEGNYSLCRQARKMLQRILDRVLAPEPVHEIHRPAFESQATSEATDAMTMDFPWFENADFDESFWTNLEEHSLLAFNSAEAVWP